MLDKKQFVRITLAMPFLQRADENLKRELQQHAQFARIPAGHDVFVDGDRVDGIALLLSGVVRVYKIGETGREITLYRFGLGQSCILSANAILSQKSFPAIATVEEEAEAVMIPADVFRSWVNKYDLLHAQVVGGAVLVVAELRVQHVGDCEAGIETDQIGPARAGPWGG